jgi:hypothetical protein
MQTKNSAVAVLALLLSISGCGPATAIASDSATPAQCIAVFGEVRRIILAEKPSELMQAVQMTARGIFEARKLKEAGTFRDARSEGAEFLKKIAHNSKALGQFYVEFSSSQNNNPQFLVENQTGSMMNTAKKVDPACQANAACRASIK